MRTFGFGHAYLTHNRCRANMAHTRQSRPHSGLGFQGKVVETFQVVPSSLGSGTTGAFPGTSLTWSRGDRLESRIPKPETRNPKPETRNLKPETRNPKPETQQHAPPNTDIGDSSRLTPQAKPSAKTSCEDRLGTGPPRARTDVIYVDLGYWAISGWIHPKGDPASWGITHQCSGS